MKLWLDDCRPAPQGWIWAKTVPEAIAHLKTGKVTHASFDHDLGEGRRTGYHLVKWLSMQSEKYGRDFWPSRGIPEVHSQNPVGRRNMVATINRYCPLARV